MAERIDDIGFGGYRLIQDTDTFCYGIDAVLLADFAARNRHKKIADLGTNNAVIPIILSSISRAEKIVGIEKQEVPFHVAERNVEMNGLSDKIEIIHTDILDIEKHFPRGSFLLRYLKFTFISTRAFLLLFGVEQGSGANT